MGSIRKRGSRWEARYDEMSPEGKRLFRSRSFSKEKEAKAFLASVETQQNTGQYVSPSDRTLGVYLEEWLAVFAKPKVSGKTFEEYTACLRKHVVAHLGKRQLVELGGMEIARLYNRKAQELSQSRLRHIHVVLNQALEKAIDLRYISHNPAARLKLPTSSKAPRPKRTYSVEETLTLLERARGTSYYIGIFLAVYTGMRLGEVCALSWEDVNLDRGTLTIRRSLEQTKEHGLRFKTPKNGDPRTITIEPEVVAELRTHQEMQDERRRLLGSFYQDRGLVFALDDGNPRCPDGFSNTFADFIKRTGLPKITFHQLRHSHATLCQAAKVDLNLIKNRLGHRTYAITADLYAHVDAEMDRGASQAFGALLRGQSVGS